MVIALLLEEKACLSMLRGVCHVYQLAQVKKHEKVVSTKWMMMMMMMKEMDENVLEGELKIDLQHLRNIQE